jgi:predicted Zn-dependent peptidase
VYSGECAREHASAMTELLAEVLRAPRFTGYLVEELKGSFTASAAERAESATLVEAVYAAAFGARTALGRGLWAEEEDVAFLSAAALNFHAGRRFTAANTVLAGVNVGHKELVEAAGRGLGGLPAAAPRMDELLRLSGGGEDGEVLGRITAAEAAQAAAPRYVGGECYHRSAAGNLATVAVALPAPAVGGAGAAAAAVLASLLGGTASRSPNAPGLLGASRLALAPGPHHDMRAFYLPLRDSGLFGVEVDGEDGDVRGLVKAAVGALKSAAKKPPTAGELAAAKAGAKLALVASREGRARLRSALGSDALRGVVVAEGAALAALEAVTADDVARLAKASLAADPAVAAIASLDLMPPAHVVSAMLKSDKF